MIVQHVSIVDLNQESCPSDKCNHLPDILQRCMPDRGMGVERINGLPQESTCPPVTPIIVRISSIESLSRLLPSLRKSSQKASIFGMFCTDDEVSSSAVQSMVDDLDDFLSCPFSQIDLTVRVQRLLGTGRESPTPESMSFFQGNRGNISTDSIT